MKTCTGIQLAQCAAGQSESWSWTLLPVMQEISGTSSIFFIFLEGAVMIYNILSGFNVQKWDISESFTQIFVFFIYILEPSINHCYRLKRLYFLINLLRNLKSKVWIVCKQICMSFCFINLSGCWILVFPSVAFIVLFSGWLWLSLWGSHYQTGVRKVK